jgi:transcriptional regulator with XRE-family HTH domain
MRFYTACGAPSTDQTTMKQCPERGLPVLSTAGEGVASMAKASPATPRPERTTADVERGQRVRKAYLLAGLNRAEFSRRLGRLYHDVTRIEEGQWVSAETLALMADITGVTERWIVRGPDYHAEFHDWLSNGAPPDLHDLEREVLGAIVFPRETHPGAQWYSVALGSWRMGSGGALQVRTHVRKRVKE